MARGAFLRSDEGLKQQKTPPIVVKLHPLLLYVSEIWGREWGGGAGGFGGGSGRGHARTLTGEVLHFKGELPVPASERRSGASE